MTSFQIKFLGTGSAFSRKYYHTNALLTINGEYYLIDCSYKSIERLEELGISLDQIKGFVITHIHGDHTGGLEEAGFKGKYLYNKKFDLYIASNNITWLWDKTLAGALGVKGYNLEDYFNVCTFEENKTFHLESLPFTPYRVIHDWEEKPAYAFLIGDKVFYSGDCEFNEKLLINLSPNISHIFHDCQLFKGPVHASLEELATLPENIRKKIHIVHYGDNLESKVEEINSYSMNIVYPFDEFIL